MVAEKINSSSSEEESSRRPDWQALRPIPLTALEGQPNNQESVDTRIAGVISLGDEIIWQRPEDDAEPEEQSSGQGQQEADEQPAYEVHDSASQPTGEAYQPIDTKEDKPPLAPPPLMQMPSRSPEFAPAQSAPYENTLGKRELLRVAKDVKIDGISLKDIYEAGRIDEEGLRSIVGSYLRGGDVRKQLTKELIVKERSYERDPNLRHTRAAEEKERRSRRDSRADKNESGLLSSLGLGGVLDSVQGVAQNAGKTAKSAGSVVTRGAKIVQHDLIDNSNTTDWISVTAVVVLWSIILVLLLS